jgi:hypothetical protein
MSRQNFAGLSMKGGRNDRFIFCLIEYFPDQERWFLKSLLQTRDEEVRDGDEAIRSWIKRYQLNDIVVDFPLSNPACQQCVLDCPGSLECPDPSVVKVRSEMEHLLEEDLKIQQRHPKEYERRRVADLEIDYSRDLLAKDAHHHLLSRSFKRRLKKGYVPYWNRPIDFWVWRYYYDQLQSLFNLAYDSFGTTSLMIQSRFSYLRRHFPAHLNLYESSVPILLIELLRANILSKRDLQRLGDIDFAAETRLDIIKKVEDRLKVFIYDKDLEVLVENPRAFDSFLLALVGQNIHQNQQRAIPDWVRERSFFITPDFSS